LHANNEVATLVPPPLPTVPPAGLRVAGTIGARAALNASDDPLFRAPDPSSSAPTPLHYPAQPHHRTPPTLRPLHPSSHHHHQHPRTFRATSFPTFASLLAPSFFAAACQRHVSTSTSAPRPFRQRRFPCRFPRHHAPTLLRTSSKLNAVPDSASAPMSVPLRPRPLPPCDPASRALRTSRRCSVLPPLIIRPVACVVQHVLPQTTISHTLPRPPHATTISPPPTTHHRPPHHTLAPIAHSVAHAHVFRCHFRS